MLDAQHHTATTALPHIALTPSVAPVTNTAHWYALSTLPRNEKSVAKHLEMRGFEVFLPTYGAARVWKNRQRRTVQLPLFIGYVFTRIRFEERFRALEATGAIRFVGNSKGPIAIPSAEIDFFRSRYCSENFEPFEDFVVGQQVRISRGVMEGVEGVLVRKNSDVRFVLTIKLINQHIAAVVNAGDLEPL